MTAKTFATLKGEFQESDPQDFTNDLLDSLGGYQLLISDPVTFESATLTIDTIPANSLIKSVHVVRTEAWDAITTFEVGKAGDTDWLVTTVQANMDGAIATGEEGAVESIEVMKAITTATAIVLTLDQGAASQGAGYVLVEYAPLA